MIDFISLLILNALFIWGINCLFNEGFILNGVGKLIERTIGTTASKPLFLCPPCMSSVYGVIGFWLYFGLSWLIIPYVICLCGLNYIIKEYLYP